MAATDGKIVLGLTMDDKGATGKMTGVARKYKEVEVAVNKTASATGRLARTSQKQLSIQQRMGQMASRMGSMVSGYVGIYSAVRAIQGAYETYQKFASRRMEFEKSITPLLSLGDNVNRIGAVKKEIIGMSNAWGRATEEVADFQYFLESGTAGFSTKLVRQIKNEALELSAATGSELKPTVDSMIKTWQIYGKEIESVNALQNKLFYTIREGYLAAGDVAEQMPRFLPAGKALGLTLDEQLAMMIELSKVTGSVEEAALGVRNIPMIMEEAQKKGVKFFGTWQEKLVQLNKYMDANRTKMLELFGRRVFTVAAGGSQKISEIEEHVRKLGELTDAKNLAGDTIFKRYLTDVQSLNAALQGVAEQIKLNVELGSALPDAQQKMLGYTLGEANAIANIKHPFFVKTQGMLGGAKAWYNTPAALELERDAIENMARSGEGDPALIKAWRADRMRRFREQKLEEKKSQLSALNDPNSRKFLEQKTIGPKVLSWLMGIEYNKPDYDEQKQRLERDITSLESALKMSKDTVDKEKQKTEFEQRRKEQVAPWIDALKTYSEKQASETEDNTQAVRDNTLAMLQAKQRIAGGADSGRGGGITKANPAVHVRGRMPPGLHSAYGLMRGQEMHSAYYPDKGQIVYDAYGRKVRPRKYTGTMAPSGQIANASGNYIPYHDNAVGIPTTQAQVTSIPYANLARIPKKKRDPNWVKSRLAPMDIEDTFVFDLWKARQPAPEPTYFDEWLARKPARETRIAKSTPVPVQPSVAQASTSRTTIGGVEDVSILKLLAANNKTQEEQLTVLRNLEANRAQRRPTMQSANAQGGA